MSIITYFFKAKTGCLHGKTPKQKHQFFTSLSGFLKTDIEFFKQQYFNLKKHEQKEFDEFLNQQALNNKLILKMLDTLKDLTSKPN